MVPKQNPNPPQWPRFNTRMDIAAQHRPRCIVVLNARTPERQNVRTPLGITQTVAPNKGLATTRGRWRADKRWTGVLDRVTALLAPKSFHSLLSFSSLSGTPFWCCCGAVDSCSPIRCSALNCCLNRVISSPSFGRLLSHHPIDCPHGPPSPSISAIPPDYSSLQDQTGLLGLPFRTVVFLAAIAFLCPDALRSNNRFLPCVAAHRVPLSGKYSLPHDRQISPRIQPPPFPSFGGTKEEARTISAAL